MANFSFISQTGNIGESASYKTFAVPSPDNDYSVVMKYYSYLALEEGDYYTKDIPNLFSDLYLYIRKKDENFFYAYNYYGNIWIRRHKENETTVDIIMNLAEVSFDVEKEWKYLISFIIRNASK